MVDMTLSERILALYALEDKKAKELFKAALVRHSEQNVRTLDRGYRLVSQPCKHGSTQKDCKYQTCAGYSFHPQVGRVLV